ncbi:hypothetical protein [Bordetella bronchiseptica]|uniref:hypothetical protein n=1 Tax=Bordetella bronchiseptica TaxID=518 RepID=UPI003EDBF1A4
MPYDPMNQVHPGPQEGIDRIPADTTQARTGNTEREQETWFAGVEEGQRRTEHNAAVRRSADGWKLVPIEPTPEMIKAWHDTYSKAVIKTGRSNRAYAAMLAAAPSPAPSAPGDAQKVYHFEQRSRFGPWIEVEKPTAKSVEFVKRSGAPAAGDALDAARWRFVRRKLCLTRNGDGTCAMQAINLPASIPGWPELGSDGAEFCDAAIDAAIAAQRHKGDE